MSDRTIDALKLIVEELDEHSRDIAQLKEGQRRADVVAAAQGREIEDLQRQVRDLQIRERKRNGEQTTKIANDTGLSVGRISQITAPLRKN